MRGNYPKLLILLLALLFITNSLASYYGQVNLDEIDEYANNDDDDDFDLEADFNFNNIEIEDVDSESLKDITLQRGLLLVLFTDASNETNEEYEKFFKTLAPFINSEALDLDLGLARISAKEGLKLSSHFKPSEYPALVLYDHQRKFVYDGNLELVDFFNWLTPIVSRELIELNDQESLREFIQSDNSLKLVAFYSSNNEKEQETLEDLLQNSYFTMLDIRKVAICSDNCPNEYNGQTFSRPSLVLFRNYENIEKTSALTTDLTNITEVFGFCTLESIPPVLIFDEVNMTKMFEDVFKGQIILIVDPNMNNTEVLSDFHKSAIYNREKDPISERVLHAVYFNHGEEDGIQWFFSVNNIKTFPKVFLTETSTELDRILKYESPRQEKVDFNYFRDFMNDFRNRKLNRYFISEEEPTSQDKASKKIVGSTFKSEVLENNDDYIMFVCEDFSSDKCQNGLDVFESLAQRIDKDTLKFGYIDISKNEVEFEISDEFPQISLYKSDGKPSSIRYKSSDVTKRQLLDFIKEWLPEVQLSVEREDNLEDDEYARKNRLQSIEL